MNINKIILVTLLFLGINILVTADELNLSERDAIEIIDNYFKKKQLFIRILYTYDMPVVIEDTDRRLSRMEREHFEDFIDLGLLNLSIEEKEIEETDYYGKTKKRI